uniref:Uncharacterized protein n=2 Tax=Meloidogyne TaxID=189290 RepID=A0A6V7TXW9_MELEN|nr:unnamed protein product [Meloidogyne enterolobii]CAD2163031.1 unnamed protein product [Meloidogyne enterolobii]
MDRQGDDDFANRKVFIDDLNHIRLVNPALLESSSSLVKEGKQFIGQFDNFIKTVRDVREAMEKIGRITDGERLRLLTLQNQLDKSGNSTSSEETQQLQLLLNEKQKELERLYVELQSLKEVEAKQNEYLMISKKL